MANKQTFKLHDVNVNGIDLGGVGSLGLTIQDIAVASRGDGAFGVEHDTSLFKRITASIDTFDVDQIMAVMAAAPSTVVAKVVNAGLTTDNIYIIGGQFVITGVSARFPVGGIASMSLNGEFRWGSADTLADMIVYTTAPGVATNTPARYIRPNTVKMGTTSILHVQEIAFSASAKIASDMADTNNGPEALDVIEWGAARVSVTFKDGTLASAIDAQQTMITLGEEVAGLTALLVGQGAASDKTLTILNTKFRQGVKTMGEDYSTFTIEGVAPWMNDAGSTEYSWNSTAKMINIA